ncbi:hypothetical protein NX059_006590 [Plenodomus lindquistii]|nr:hypothetical protein NX059_006590 [Plenodomus lindquistii]
MRSVLMPYGSHWRRVRRIFNNVLTAKKCDTYVRLQEDEAVASIQRIREDSTIYRQEIHRYAISVARSIAFGKRVPSCDDPFAIKITRLMERFAEAMTPGRYLFEYMPILRRLPRFLQPWLPELESARDHENEAALENYRDALAYSKTHPNLPSIARDIHEEMGASGEISELQAATTCMEVLGAGSDTTANSILFTIMAMVAYPEVLRKAHEELDRVIGQDRMPTFADEPNLPYVRAIIKEQQRWRCIAPMSFQHCSDKENTYNGYRIPKGANVRVNSWAIHMDPNRYSNPEEFAPERYLDYNLPASAYANSPDANARDHFAYGGGKRICVGIHLAERSLFSMTSRLLHSFNIKPALDGEGQEIPVDVNNVVTALIMAPADFPARFEVRSEAIAKLLDREFAEHVKHIQEMQATE